MSSTPTPAELASERARPPRYRGLDYVRGLASVIVVCQHYSEFIRARAVTPEWTAFGALAKTLISEWVDFGKIGIAAFFCVSGAIIPISLAVKGNVGRKLALKRFGLARFFRLYPMYWTSLLLAIAMGWAEVSGSALLVNATMLQRFVGVQDALGVYWTLQIELIFYAACAGLFAVGYLHRPDIQTWLWRGILGLGVLLAVARYATGLKLPVALALALSLMFFCCRWRMYLLSPNEPSVDRPSLVDYATLVIGILVVCCFAYSRDYGFGETWYRYFISYMVGLLLFKLLASATLPRAGKVLAPLGQSSYALYLLHPIVGFEVLDLFRRFWPTAPVVACGVALVASIAASYLAYALLEMPAIALGKRLSGSLVSAPASDPDAATSRG